MTLFFFFSSSAVIHVSIFSVWLKTILLPMWPREAKTVDTARLRQRKKISVLTIRLLISEKFPRPQDGLAQALETKGCSSPGAHLSETDLLKPPAISFFLTAAFPHVLSAPSDVSMADVSFQSKNRFFFFKSFFLVAYVLFT